MLNDPWVTLYQDKNHGSQASFSFTVKPALSGHSKRRPKIDFEDQLSLNAGQKYCRMLQESILQYFRPSLSYHLSLRPLCCLMLRGYLRQVLLYIVTSWMFGRVMLLSDLISSHSQVSDPGPEGFLVAILWLQRYIY